MKPGITKFAGLWDNLRGKTNHLSIGGVFNHKQCNFNISNPRLMKKLLLAIFAIIFFQAATAQVWCPPGARWHFKRGGTYIGSFSNCDIDIAYTSDTTVMGIPCKKLKGTLFGQINYSYSFYSPIYSQSYGTYITYLSNSKVLFLYNTGKAVFDTVVNFNALPGDKWLRPGPDPDPNGCISRVAYTVTDTAHVLINGFNLKKITVTFPSDTNSSITFTNVFLERMLVSSLSSNDLFPLHCQLKYTVFDAPSTRFRCYEDDLFPTYNVSNEACKNFWTGINSQALNTLGFKAYPNPATHLLTIELPDASKYELKLSNLLGQAQPLNHIALSHSKLQADLSPIDAGIYFIQVLENGRLVGVEKFIKN
jgi:hypothetical protein